MKTSEKQELKQKIKQLGIFLLIVFIPAMIISICLDVAGVSFWINVVVLVVVLMILFILYVFILEKINKRKSKRMEKKKDPFSD